MHHACHHQTTGPRPPIPPQVPGRRDGKGGMTSNSMTWTHWPTSMLPPSYTVRPPLRPQRPKTSRGRVPRGVVCWWRACPAATRHGLTPTYRLPPPRMACTPLDHHVPQSLFPIGIPVGPRTSRGGESQRSGTDDHLYMSCSSLSIASQPTTRVPFRLPIARACSTSQSPSAHACTKFPSPSSQWRVPLSPRRVCVTSSPSQVPHYGSPGAMQ